MTLPDFKAVILDMDGLVLDTESGYIMAWQQAARALGYELNDGFCRSLSGLQYPVLRQKLLDFCGSGLDLKAFHEKSGFYWRHHVRQQGIAVKSGFYTLHRILSEYNVPYILATNSVFENADECLQIAGIRHLFPEIISRDQVQAGKPAPDILFKAAATLGCAICECLVVEDSLTGLQAAGNAGAFSVLVPSVSPLSEQCSALAGLRLDNLTELAEIIRVRFVMQDAIDV